MYRKGAQDKKRAKIFSRIGREITVAVKMGGGTEPQSNPRLRVALSAARNENMPKDNVERAIKKGNASDANSTLYEEIRYEGYAPCGVAIMVETMTDNRNRTGAQIRSIFSKNGGSLGETGSVGYMFARIGEMFFPSSIPFDDILNAALEANADDVSEADDNLYRVTCQPDKLHQIADDLASALQQEPRGIAHVWNPQNLVSVPSDKALSVLNLIETLDNHDDVQLVSSNFDISEEDMKKITP